MVLIDSERVESSSEFSDNETPVTISISSDGTFPSMEIHRVGLPPKRSTFQKLKHKLSEIFFPDDPLHRFVNQPFLRKWVLGLEYMLPIFQWLPTYTFQLFRSDLISGLTIASLAIPQVNLTKLNHLSHFLSLLSFSVYDQIAFFFFSMSAA